MGRKVSSVAFKTLGFLAGTDRRGKKLKRSRERREERLSRAKSKAVIRLRKREFAERKAEQRAFNKAIAKKRKKTRVEGL